jgi:hypothetical protein
MLLPLYIASCSSVAHIQDAADATVLGLLNLREPLGGLLAVLRYPYGTPAVPRHIPLQYPYSTPTYTPTVPLQYPYSTPTVPLQYPCSTCSSRVVSCSRCVHSPKRPAADRARSAVWKASRLNVRPPGLPPVDRHLCGSTRLSATAPQDRVDSLMAIAIPSAIGRLTAYRRPRRLTGQPIETNGAERLRTEPRRIGGSLRHHSKVQQSAAGRP